MVLLDEFLDSGDRQSLAEGSGGDLLNFGGGWAGGWVNYGVEASDIEAKGVDMALVERFDDSSSYRDRQATPLTLLTSLTDERCLRRAWR